MISSVNVMTLFSSIKEEKSKLVSLKVSRKHRWPEENNYFKKTFTG
jgi:hypothetical protein